MIAYLRVVEILVVRNEGIGEFIYRNWIKFIYQMNLEEEAIEEGEEEEKRGRRRERKKKRKKNRF